MDTTKHSIALKSRYGEEWIIEELTDDEYMFPLPPHTRIGFDEENIVRFIDPPGGPFLCVGDYLEDKKIKSIEDRDTFVIIKFEKEA